MSNESEELILGSYAVLKKKDGALWQLGKGGYGTTYKAEHKLLRRVCALKVINEHLVSNDDARMRFLQEARTAALLDHPHIAKIYDFGESDGCFYYAMAFCAGGDLEQFSSARGPQPWSVVRELAVQILGALGTAHSAGLLHRDMKPSNVMLADDDGTVSLRLIDFGLVKVLNAPESQSTNMTLTREGAFMGNTLTASPEQLREEELDERTDLFSVGITLWYLLLGGSPFKGATAAELVHQRLSGDNYDDLLPEDLEEEGRLVLSGLLKKNLGQRFRNTGEVLDMLQGGTTDSGNRPVATTSSAEVTHRDTPAVATAGVQCDWSEVWGIQRQLKKFNYGTYYGCDPHETGMLSVTMFLPNEKYPFLESVMETADKLVTSHTQLLSGYYQRGTYSEAPAYVSSVFPSGEYQSLLQVEGHLTFQDHLPILQQIASAVDECMETDIPGVELDVGDVLLGLREGDDSALQTQDEWLAYFNSQKQAGVDYISDLDVTLLPRLIQSSDIDETMVTLSNDDLATNPIARFGGLLYRSISGMAVKQSAYLSPTAHVSTSNISEESNRYLSAVIAAQEEPDSAMIMLRHLCDLEGADWKTKALDAAAAMKDLMRTQLTQTHTSLTPSPGGLRPIETKKPRPHQAAEDTDTVALSSAHPSLQQEDPAGSTSVQNVPPPAFDSSKYGELNPPESQNNVADQVQPIAKNSSKGKLVILIAAVAACIALAGGMGWWFFGREDTKSKGANAEQFIPQVANPVTLQFLNVTKGAMKFSTDEPYLLEDKEGVLLARFMASDGKASVGNISAELFDSSDAWPLKIKLSENGFAMAPVTLNRNDFTDAGDDHQSYSESIKLIGQPYIDVNPVVNYNGSALTLAASTLRKHLHAEDPSLDWKLSEYDGKLRVVLPSESNFPIKALIIFPGMEELPFSFDRDSQPEWNLKLAQRVVKLTGLGEFSSMEFVPDYSKLPSSAIKQALEGNPIKTDAQVSGFENGTGQWALPALSGKVNVTSASNKWSFPLSADTKFRVLTSADRSGSMDMGSEAFLKLLKQAETGNADAQFKVGIIYLDGDGVSKNEEAATSWFKLGAMAGDKAAQFNYGLHLELGIGVQKNLREAIRQYHKAAEQGHPKAQLNLGLCYQFGSGVRQSYKDAEKWLVKSASGGSAEGMFNLAVLYGDEAAGMVNRAKAVELYTEASDLGFAPAMFNLGVHYENGMGGLTPDKSKAMELYRKAAAKKYKNAIDLLKERE